MKHGSARQSDPAKTSGRHDIDFDSLPRQSKKKLEILGGYPKELGEQIDTLEEAGDIDEAVAKQARLGIIAFVQCFYSKYKGRLPKEEDFNNPLMFESMFSTELQKSVLGHKKFNPNTCYTVKSSLDRVLKMLTSSSRVDSCSTFPEFVDLVKNSVQVNWESPFLVSEAYKEILIGNRLPTDPEMVELAEIFGTHVSIQRLNILFGIISPPDKNVARKYKARSTTEEYLKGQISTVEEIQKTEKERLAEIDSRASFSRNKNLPEHINNEMLALSYYLYKEEYQREKFPEIPPAPSKVKEKGSVSGDYDKSSTNSIVDCVIRFLAFLHDKKNEKNEFPIDKLGIHLTLRRDLVEEYIFSLISKGLLGSAASICTNFGPALYGEQKGFIYHLKTALWHFEALHDRIFENVRNTLKNDLEKDLAEEKRKPHPDKFDIQEYESDLQMLEIKPRELIKSRCRNIHTTVTTPHNRKVKDLRQKNKRPQRKDRILKKNERPIDDVVKMLKLMQEALKRSDPKRNPTEYYELARAMAIFALLVNFPLRQENVREMMLVKELPADDTVVGCFFTFDKNDGEEGIYKGYIHASELKNEKATVRFKIRESFNQFINPFYHLIATNQGTPNDPRIKTRRRKINQADFNQKDLTKLSRLKEPPVKPESVFFGLTSSTEIYVECVTFSRHYLQIKDQDGINPHAMRAIVATHYRKSGVPLEAAAILLLDSPDTVAKFYSDFDESEELEKAQAHLPTP